MRQALRIFAGLAMTFPLLSLPALAQVPVPPDVDGEFERLRSQFRSQTVASLGDESFTENAPLSIWTSRALIARSAADAFNRANVRLHAEVGRQSLPDPPVQSIRTGRIGCPSCPDCDDECGDEGLLAPFCFAGCLPASGLCQVVRGACELTSALFAEKKVGEATLSNVSAFGQGELGQLRLTIQDDLAQARVSGQFGATVFVDGRLRFRPEPLVQVGLLCLEFSGDLPRIPISAPRQDLAVDSRITLTEMENGVSFDVSLSEVEPEVKVNGNPFIDFVLKNPENLLTCTLPTLLGLAADAFVGEFPIDQKIKIPGTGPQPVGAFSLDSGLGVVAPRLTGRAVGLVEKAGQETIAAETGPQTVPSTGGKMP